MGRITDGKRRVTLGWPSAYGGGKEEPMRSILRWSLLAFALGVPAMAWAATSAGFCCPLCQ
jgi:hypothetical protein